MNEIKSILSRLGWINSEDATLTALTGGVSSDIYLVHDQTNCFVVKRALEKLKVSAEWTADTSRNQFEQAYIQYVGSLRPDAMPQIIASDADAGIFAMEYLNGFTNWKESLLQGECDVKRAHAAGKLLGEVHQHSWQDQKVAENFNAMKNLDELRVDPYLRFTATRNPELSDIILKEADRIIQSQQCLIHGDFSPKNILYKGDRIIPLDCEVACYGDAAFDLSFFINHLFLKSLYHENKFKGFHAMITAARNGYREANEQHSSEIEQHCSILLPILMLARVDGKSPVEYLTPSKQQWIREFVTEQLTSANNHLDNIQQLWFERLNRTF